jgi:predicted methyltransferase MtxX (methanogen marker protein 4)
MKASTKAIRFLESLSIHEGPKGDEKVKLTPFQQQFVRGALANDVNVAVLSIGQRNAKAASSIHGANS